SSPIGAAPGGISIVPSGPIARCHPARSTTAAGRWTLRPSAHAARGRSPTDAIRTGTRSAFTLSALDFGLSALGSRLSALGSRLSALDFGLSTLDDCRETVTAW